MQMKALRSANFAKLSSSNSTRDVYWDTSISAGTPGGYCLSQMRSMVFPLWFGPRFLGRDALFGAVLSNAAADGKRQRVIDVSLTNREPVLASRNRLNCVARRRSFDPPAWPRWYSWV